MLNIWYTVYADMVVIRVFEFLYSFFEIAFQIISDHFYIPQKVAHF